MKKPTKIATNNFKFRHEQLESLIDEEMQAQCKRDQYPEQPVKLDDSAQEFLSRNNCKKIHKNHLDDDINTSKFLDNWQSNKVTCWQPAPKQKSSPIKICG